MSEVREAYSRWSETYDTDRNRTRDLDGEVTRRVLGPERRGPVLELGCGTGKNTAFLATLADQVLALDFSEGMLARAREKVTAPHVTFAAADLTRPWPCEPGFAELVVGNLVLEHVADLEFIFREVARCLRPGGRLFLSELHPFRQYQGTVANFTLAGEAVEIPAHLHHVSEFLSAAAGAGLALERLEEWWHEEDAGLPPRLLTLLFRKPESGMLPECNGAGVGRRL